MESSPLALPVISLLLIAFGLTVLLSLLEAFIAHAFYIAIRDQNNLRDQNKFHSYHTVPQQTPAFSKKRGKLRVAPPNAIKMGTIYETPGGVGAGMRIDPFLHGMQNRMESAKTPHVCVWS
jgi:hypothetical protein